MENSIKCINCNGSYPSHSKHVKQFGGQSLLIKSIITHWLSPHVLTEHDNICMFCLMHAERAERKIISQNKELTTEEILKSELTKVDNRLYCIMCGGSILRRVRTKSIFIPSPTEEEENAIKIVRASLGAHKKINPDSKICRKCWCKVERHAKKSSKKNYVQNEGTITESSSECPRHAVSDSEWNALELPNYKKISYTNNRCIFEDCSNSEENLIPVSNNHQVKTLKVYNIYIPPNSMICDKHLKSDNWRKLYKNKTNVSTFTAEDIEQIFSLVQTKANTDVNFKNYMTIDDHTFIYFLGINRETLTVILKYLPQIEEMNHGVLGLIGLFIKHENGGPNDRIASLLKLSEESLEIEMENVKELLVQNPVVTTNMGIEYLLKKDL